MTDTISPVAAGDNRTPVTAGENNPATDGGENIAPYAVRVTAVDALGLALGLELGD